MVRDRLAELKKNYSGLLNDKDLPITLDVDNDSNSNNNQIDQLLNEYSQIRLDVDEIKDNIQLMQNIAYPSTRSFRNSTSNSLDEIERKKNMNMTLCKKILEKMKSLEVNLPANNDFSTLARMKRINFYCVKEDFVKAWSQHEFFLVQYETKIKTDLMRQAKLIDANITEEETETLIATNATSLFVGNILEDTQMARQNLRDLLVRHSDLAKIERSITEVRDMFIRISTLVMEQSSMIQVIEYHAQLATNHVDKGTVNLEKAREKKIKTLKRKTCILIWLAVILTILIIIMIFL